MRIPIALLLVLLPGLGAQAEPKTLTVGDAADPARLVPRGLPNLQWHPDGGRFTHLRPRRGEVELVARSVGGGAVAVLCTWSALSKALEAAGVEGAKPPVMAGLSWAEDGSLRLEVDGARFVVRLDPMEVEPFLPRVEGAEPVVLSPDERHAAYVKEHDVWVLEDRKETIRVTFDGSEDLTHGVSVSRIEFGIRDGLWWDPTGRRVAFYQEDFRPIDPYPYVDFGPRPARLVPGRYPMAGRSGSRVRVGVFDLASRTTAWLETDPEVDEYLTNVTWHPSGDRIVVAHVNRDQDRCDVVEYDAATGRRNRLLFVESDPEWVEPEMGPVFLPDGSGDFLWASFRGGHRHLWRYRGDGRLVGRVTRGAFDLDGFVRWDPSGTGFFWTTTGPDVRQRHLYHTTLDGRQRRVTAGRGHHAAKLSPDARHLLDVHESLVLPKATDLVRTDSGKVVRRVHEAKDPLEGYRRCREQLFTVQTEKGDDLHGYLLLPPEGTPGAPYPVIDYVYAGPHSQLVQDRWLGGLSRWKLWLHAMAHQGYASFVLDGRGTKNRGIEWQQAVHRRLGTLEAEDQVRGLRHVLAREDTDPDRVGVTGWSYGGFMTLTLMTRKPEWYRAGVAGAPVTDWAYYETGFGERYMDRPEENPEGYRRSDPGRHADQLEGRLLVVQGSSDETVMWQNTLAFLRRCIDAGTPVDYMVYPGQKHGLHGKDLLHYLRKSADYFDLHVKNAAPRPEEAESGKQPGR